jgi:NAD(P)-dependent dehydrogenase (short-subunit alcohol dehydrogenase family)
VLYIQGIDRHLTLISAQQCREHLPVQHRRNDRFGQVSQDRRGLAGWPTDLRLRYAVPHLKPGASIINTSSVTAFKGSAGMMDYSATKGAIITFTRSLAMQLAPKHIRVNAVCPGPVYTPLQPASRPADNMDDWSVGALPLHGRANMPAEMGPAYGELHDRIP